MTTTQESGTQESGRIIDLREPTDEISVVPGAPARADEPVVVTEPPAAKVPTLRRGDAAAVVRQGLTIFSALVAAMLAFLFVFSGFSEARAQTGLRRHFAFDIKELLAPTGGAIASGAPVAEIDIAAIGLHEIVVQGSTSGVLRNGPGHLRQTPLPGQAGNAVIFGRRAAFGGPFRHIPALAPGQSIQVTTAQGNFTYVVTAVTKADAGNGNLLASVSGQNDLTLVTSDPAFLASRRLYVTARLHGTPFAAAPDPTPVTGAELGLAGDSSGLLSLILWLEALLVAAIGATWLWRRWARWSAYVVTVPVLLAITWIVFEGAARLLPATL